MTEGMVERDFTAEVAALEAQLTTQRDVAVARLRTAHEAWARSVLAIEAGGNLVAQVRVAVEHGVDTDRARDAIERLREATERQWEIGSWSSGSGEGLSSMFEVRSLQLAQAWLWSARSSTGAADEARALLTEVRDDPNRIAERHAGHMQALAERLKG